MCGVTKLGKIRNEIIGLIGSSAMGMYIPRKEGDEIESTGEKEEKKA